MNELSNDEKARIFDLIFQTEYLTPERLTEITAKATTLINAPKVVILRNEDVNDLNLFHYNLLEGFKQMKKDFSKKGL